MSISSMQAVDTINSYLETVQTTLGSMMEPEEVEAFMSLLEVCKVIHGTQLQVTEMAEMFTKRFGGETT